MLGYQYIFFFNEWQKKKEIKKRSFYFKIYPSIPHLPTKQKPEKQNSPTASPTDINENHHFFTFLSWINTELNCLLLRTFIRLILHLYKMKSTTVNKHA